MLKLTMTVAALLATPLASAQRAADPIAAAVAAPDRTPANRLRDRYRHPVETLRFFGVRPTQTVVEFMPAGGWYTEILAPLLSQRGHYIGLVPASARSRDAFAQVLAKGGARYRGATTATIDLSNGTTTDVPANSVDTVLTFRNVHNLLMEPGLSAPATFGAFFRMLKPGGTLGVVDHHLPESMSAEAERKSGYLKRSTVVRLAQAAGFTLAAESPVNANPKDTHDWPRGVWTLPPTLTLGDADRAKYLAIGESDRMTLRFVKPRG